MKALLLVAALSGCGTETATPPPKPAPPATPPPAASPTPGTAAAAVTVGPDGPESIPVPKFEVSTDPAIVAKGQAVFDAKGCGACHQFGSKLVGPDLDGVLTRRSPTWTARMILNPEKMVKEDPTAKKLPSASSWCR
jgi:mono/diheme cytochrome c family protein